MIPILICSIWAAAIIIERFITLKKSTANTRHLMMKVKGLILKNDIEEAIAECEETPGPTARVLKEGMLRSERNKEEIQEAIEAAGKEQVYYLERYLGILATIAGVAPLIGFLGTVTGMIEAFMQIERLGGDVNATVLSGGIWEALMTTAFGLFVGIVVYIFYNVFVNRVKRFIFEMETSSSELVELLVNGRGAA
ncbi:MotA/TolQ/ExbB proton channel family protein [candidate division KSB1 bacterium]